MLDLEAIETAMKDIVAPPDSTVHFVLPLVAEVRRQATINALWEVLACGYLERAKDAEDEVERLRRFAHPIKYLASLLFKRALHEDEV